MDIDGYPRFSNKNLHWLVVEPYRSEKYEFVNGRIIPFLLWKIQFHGSKSPSSYPYISHDLFVCLEWTNHNPLVEPNQPHI